MNYLTQEAAIVASNCIKEAIKKMEDALRCAGNLAHKDAKMNDEASEYFKRQVSSSRLCVELLYKLSADLSRQAWEAYNRENDYPLIKGGNE